MVFALRLLLLPVMFLAVVLATAWQTGASERGQREVLLLPQRYGEALHFLDSETLEPIGRIDFGSMVESVAADASAGRLFVRVGMGQGCCNLVSLDLRTLESCVVAFPSMGVTVDPAASVVYHVRGNVGIGRIDSRTLEGLPSLHGPGTYEVLPSPDGRWVYGLTRFRGPSLDVFDLDSGALTTRHFLGAPESDAIEFGGAWLGQRFVLYVHDGDTAYLQRVSPADAPLDYGNLQTLTMEVPGMTPGDLPRGWSVDVRPAGERLMVYQQLGDWFKGNPRRPGWEHLVGGPVRGGVFLLEPERGAAVAHLAPDTDFAFVRSNADGSRLYAVVAEDYGAGVPPRLMALDAQSGLPVAERVLEPDVWRVELVSLPEDLVPRGAARTRDCWVWASSPPGPLSLRGEGRSLGSSL